MEDLLKNQVFAHTFAAASSVALGTALTYPLDTVKVLVQVGSSSSKQLAPSKAFETVRYLSGNLAFGRIFGLGARFGIYEVLTAFCKDGQNHNYVYTSEAHMAGMVAGAAESIISSHFELIKLHAPVTSASQVPRSSSGRKKLVVPPVAEKFLHGYTPDKRVLNYSVGLLSTLTKKHPNLMGALQEYPWMMSGSGIPPSVCYVRGLPKSLLWKGGIHYGEV